MQINICTYILIICTEIKLKLNTNKGVKNITTPKGWELKNNFYISVLPKINTKSNSPKLQNFG